MKTIRYYYNMVYIFIRVTYLSLKYNTPSTKIYGLYINMYGDFKLINMFLKRMKTEHKSFDYLFEDYMKAKYAIEKLFDEGDLHPWNTKNGYD